LQLPTLVHVTMHAPVQLGLQLATLTQLASLSGPSWGAQSFTDKHA
jgi:hypothetical protein